MQVFDGESQSCFGVKRGGVVVDPAGLPGDRTLLYSALFESSQHFMALLTIDGLLLEANRAALELAGFSMAEVRGVALCDAAWWGECDACQSDIRQALAVAGKGRASRLEVELAARSGACVTLDFSITPVLGGDGRITHLLAEGLDISASKQAKLALQGSEKQVERQKRDLDEAQRMAGMGSWEWELGAEALTWSRGLYLLAGRDPALPPPSFAERKRYYTPDSWLRLRRATARAASSGRPYVLELQFIREDGEYRWVLAQGEAGRDAQGRIVRLRGTVEDISQRRRLEAERLDQSRRVANLSRRLVAVQEEERRRLAGMVHDVVSPNVAALKINLGIIHARLPVRLAQELGKALEDTRALLDDTHYSLRSLCAELRPASLDYGGLLPAIEHYAQGFSQRTGIQVDIVAGSVEKRLPLDVESLLFRIVQEALTNCLKHASASRVVVSLDHDAAHASLDIRDDGVGFNPADLGHGEHRPGIGLLTMRERAEFAGGSIRIESSPGGGTLVGVRI